MKRLILLLLIMTTVNAVNAAPLQSGFVDDTNPLLSYSGTWQDGTYGEAYGGGNYQFTDDETATLTFETFATGLTIFFIYDPLGDDIEVCVDEECATFSTLGATAVGTIELSGLPSETKTITVAKVTADTSVFAFDALYIHPSNESEVNGENQIIEFEFEGQSYTGVLDMRITSGEAILVVLISILVVLQLFTVVMQVSQ